jgi:hypothetical protein
MKKLFLFLSLIVAFSCARAAQILIPMDNDQANHLKAYGITYGVLNRGGNAQWLLNYRGGSFLFEYSKEDELACLAKGVTFQVLTDAMTKSILATFEDSKNNMKAVDMQRAPKIAVYTPPGEGAAWDDAVTMVLQYAEIPFDVVYDQEIMQGALSKYDWLHLHHEDFTGQQGRFYSGFSSAQWYKNDVARDEKVAAQCGFSKVSQLKLAVAQKIKTFIGNGGFMFAMCSATDSYDIALAADGVDICASMYDGDPADANMNSKLKYENCLAFQNFKLKTNPNEYEFSNIDTYETRTMRGVNENTDYFNLTQYSVLTQPELSMLTQNHVSKIKGFWGQTTGFDMQFIKPGVAIMGANNGITEARYIHGDFGKGMWTFYGGHDPEDYQHRVEEAPSDLSKYPNSPGYRLILDNILFPSTQNKESVASSFSAFPSPATTQLNVQYEISDKTNNPVLRVFDVTGKEEIKQQIVPGNNTAILDVSALAPGMYLWRIESGDQILHSDKFFIAR